MTITGNQETRAELLSESAAGEPVKVSADLTTTSDVDAIHIMTVDGVIDAVWMEVFNTHTTRVEIQLVLNPTDTSNATAVDDARVTRSVPALGSVWILQGQRFRRVSGNAYTIGAYVDSADVDRLRVSGWFVRVKSGALTP